MLGVRLTGKRELLVANCRMLLQLVYILARQVRLLACWMRQVLGRFGNIVIKWSRMTTNATDAGTSR
jgi:hypothetical protein